jgi:hypothetical protein
MAQIVKGVCSCPTVDMETSYLRSRHVRSNSIDYTCKRTMVRNKMRKFKLILVCQSLHYDALFVN